jgi:ABC-2 type transport system ATP-binding protein
MKREHPLGAGTKKGTSRRVKQEIVLRTTGLGKRFGTRWAVRDINLEVYRGDIFCFLGPNGAGKSTTIRMILTLLLPTTGSIEIFGKDLHTERSNVLSRVCGIIEKPDFYLYLTAYKNLEIFGSLTRRISGDEIIEALDMVGLKSRAFDKVKTFSHGMKQRLGIAQALLTTPEMIILDEPTAGLDPQGMKEVRELITMLSQKKSMTVFLSTHLLSEVELVATRMAVINQGEMIAQGTVAELLDREQAEYSLQASPLKAAVKLMRELSWVVATPDEKGTTRVRIDSARAPELLRILVTHDIEVSSFYPHRTLEDFFLKITEGISEI